MAWSGISAIDKKLDFPLVRAPFIPSVTETNEYVKIIDVNIFLTTFLVVVIVSVFAVNYILSNIKISHRSLVILYGLLFIAGIFFYFGWYPRP